MLIGEVTQFSLLDWATELGASLFPIRRGWKSPAGIVRSWIKDASRDRAQWIAWAGANPGCNWGVALGASGLVAADVDVKGHGGDREASWAAANRYWFGLTGQHLDADHAVVTPSGGVHVYYRAPPGEHIKSLAAIPGTLDIKAAGGYVVSPWSHTDIAAGDNSVKATGGYLIARWSGSLKPLPKGAVDAFRRRGGDNGDSLGGRATDGFAATRASDAERLRSRTPAQMEKTRSYAADSFARRCSHLAGRMEGGRNHSLFEAAIEGAKYAAAGLLDAAHVEARLWDAARTCGLDDREIKTTIASASRYVSEGKAGPLDIDRTVGEIFGPPTGDPIHVEGAAWAGGYGVFECETSNAVQVRRLLKRLDPRRADTRTVVLNVFFGLATDDERWVPVLENWWAGWAGGPPLADAIQSASGRWRIGSLNRHMKEVYPHLRTIRTPAVPIASFAVDETN